MVMPMKQVPHEEKDLASRRRTRRIYICSRYVHLAKLMQLHLAG
jgi:hypothetical protein